MNRLLSLLTAHRGIGLYVSVAPAQTLQVTRFEIGGEGGTDYVTANPVPAACSSRAAPTSWSWTARPAKC
jgi:hypothetical protein